MNESIDIDIKRIRAQAKVYRNSKVAKSQSSAYPSGWEPKTEAQKAALASPADILFFGGAAGSLKTETMLVDAAWHLHVHHNRDGRSTFPTSLASKTAGL